MKDFVKINKKFWSSFSTKISDKKILVEEPSISMIVHVNAIFSIILNQARSLIPIWLYNSNYDIRLLKSYIDSAQYIKIVRLRRFKNIELIFVILYKFIVVYITKNILSFSYKGVKYGDIVYDTYLLREKVATIRRIDIKLLSIMYECICRHEKIREILTNDNFEGVLVSHQVGINSGCMLRTAIHYGYKGYLRAGHHQSTLQCFEKLDEVYDYEYKPFPKDIDNIIVKLNSDINKVYESIFEKQVLGKGSKDAMYAFSPKNKYYIDRKSFIYDFNLDPTKKNIFIMLHAFNDHPHSHFRWMIFKDYYDWFIETLKFAKKNDKVNWIFKQHPSIKFYPVKDISFSSLFSNNPKNVLYIDEKNQIDTRSLIYCADVVVTCLGSAGFELPAMGKIPSVTAGDNFYTGIGFALEPKTKKQYFKILSDLYNVDKLSLEEQKRARAAYIYIYKFSRVDISACPILTLEEEKDKYLDNWYWLKALKLYNKAGGNIREQVRQYSNIVAHPKFKRLNKLYSNYNTNSKLEKTKFINNYGPVNKKDGE